MTETALLLYGDTERNAALRHELPLLIMDPFVLGIVDGRTHVVASPIEADRVRAAAPDIVLHEYRELGFYELLDGDISRDQLDLELASRAVAAMGVESAVVDREFPLVVADRLRADGVELRPDPEQVDARRRAKAQGELEGIRRAQAAAEAAMAAAADVLRRAVADGDRLVLDGEPLTAEDVRAALRRACAELGAPAPPDVIVASVWQGFGHEAGSGPLPANLPIQIDIWPRDEASGCWADMTRTFVVGEVSEPVRAQEALVREALEAVRGAVQPGVTGKELHGIACDLFETAGHRTQRTGTADDDPHGGFQFGLGHGVGLEVHEAPGLGRLGRDPLVAGDVVAIEPGLWQRDVGGVRFEDLLLVADAGCETLTRYPYGLAP
ncbi:MAG TPA: M24 family metallopeptidase [Solirubrobacterales bacterium]|nr:M24 family metallopeptidase [Solirubrobacterales bacterium]